MWLSHVWMITTLLRDGTSIAINCCIRHWRGCFMLLIKIGSRVLTHMLISLWLSQMSVLDRCLLTILKLLSMKWVWQARVLTTLLSRFTTSCHVQEGVLRTVGRLVVIQSIHLLLLISHSRIHLLWYISILVDVNVGCYLWILII
jgi:hypothetical protein